MWRNLFILYFVFVKKQRTIDRKKKRSKISALESCYANRIYVLIGVEMRAYGQKLVRNWSNLAHTQVSVTVFKTSRHSKLMFFVKKQRRMERKKRSKCRGWESCYVKKIYGTFGVEMRAYGQKLVKFCKHTRV